MCSRKAKRSPGFLTRSSEQAWNALEFGVGRISHAKNQRLSLRHSTIESRERKRARKLLFMATVNTPPIEIRVAYHYTGPSLKHCAAVAAIVFGLIIFAAIVARSSDGDPVVAPAAAVVPSTEERLAKINQELAAWQPTGQSGDLDRKLALQEERRQLTGDSINAPLIQYQSTAPLVRTTQSQTYAPPTAVARRQENVPAATPKEEERLSLGTPPPVSEAVLYQRHLRQVMKPSVHPDR